MALTNSAELTYSNMKSSLRRIFASVHCLNEKNAESIIKVKEEAFYNSGFNRFSKGKIDQRKGMNQKFNPLNKRGYISRCMICDSKMHWVNHCPHKSMRDDGKVAQARLMETNENVNIISMPSLDICYFSNIVVGSGGECLAVIDTACSRTVAGRNWVSKYLNSLNDTWRKKIIRHPSAIWFKFGDDNKLKSNEKIVLPIAIGGRECTLDVEILDTNIPLLLSKTTLKRAKTTIELDTDNVTMFGVKILIKTSLAGHYCIDVNPCNTIYRIQDSAISKKDILKLHTQFGHASIENLIKLLNNAGSAMISRSAIADVVNSCDICKRYKKAEAGPIVGFSWSEKFNDTVSMDLHQLENNIWYLHIIDNFSRFSRAIVIKNKQSITIVQKFLECWVSVFGAPKKILSDNGGEFNSKDFISMCENFNISVFTTPGYSPWSNGLCERHNKTLTETLLKVKENNDLNWETALAWSVAAKNSLINNNGFSPNQLVFGGEVNLPSIFSDKLPAQECVTTSQAIADHIVALHKARQEFIKQESSEKINRALRKNTRNSGAFHFYTGDSVYYKRQDSGWKGPGHVIGMDGPIVFIRQGGMVVRVHKCRVQHVDKAYDEADDYKIIDKKQSESIKEAMEMDNKMKEDYKTENVTADDSDSESLENGDNSRPVNSSICQQVIGNSEDLGVGKFVKFRIEDSWYSGKIESRAGKKKRKYANSYNLIYSSPNHKTGEKGYVDFDSIDQFHIIPDPENQQEDKEPVHDNVEDQIIEESAEEHIFLLTAESQDFHDAKSKELQSWIDNAVYEAVPFSNQKLISVRWICTFKNSDGKSYKKARLVARGFEEDTDNIPRDSPTCSKDSLRTVLALGMQKNWKFNTIDIKTAFLQSMEINRDVFLKPPKEAKTDLVWKLRICVYGLCDASLQWYQSVKTFMLQSGLQTAPTDPSVFYWTSDSGLEGIIAVHVDDFLWMGSDNFKQKIIRNLRITFNIGKEETEGFKYLGLQMEQNNEAVTLNQNIYIENLKLIDIEPRQDKTTSLNARQKDILRQKIGQLLWIGNNSRPDASFMICQLATRLNSATVEELFKANKVIRLLKNNNLTLTYQNLGKIENLKLVIFSNASFANLPGGGSQGGNLVFLAGENNKCSLLSWQSKKIRRVAKSSLTAETLAMSDAVDNAFFINNLISTLLWKGAKKIPMEIITDNKSLFDALKSNKPVSNKRLRIEIGQLKEMIDNKEINKVTWKDTKNQLADGLTKIGPNSQLLLNVIRTANLKTIKGNNNEFVTYPKP